MTVTCINNVNYMHSHVDREIYGFESFCFLLLHDSVQHFLNVVTKVDSSIPGQNDG